MRKSIDYDATWASLRKVIFDVLTLKPVDRIIWSDSISDIYSICISSSEYIERIYNDCKEFLISHITHIKKELTGVYSQALLKKYYEYWIKFSSGASYLNSMFTYLNRSRNYMHGSDSSYEQMPYSSQENEELPAEIGQIAMQQWQEIIIEEYQVELVNVLLAAIENDRKEENIPVADLVQGVIHSFGKFFYQSVFEARLLEETKNFYARELARLRESYDFSGFIKAVKNRIDAEQHRCQKFFHVSSHSKVLKACISRLTAEQIDYLNCECARLVKNELIDDLNCLYKLLRLVDNGLKVMLQEIESHIKRIGKLLVINLFRKTCEDYVNAMLKVSDRFSTLIQQAFEEDPEFKTIFGKAIRAVINHSNSSSTPIRAAEILARYADILLKKGSKNWSDAELDDKQSHVINLFKYVDDKDLFQKFYSKFLAKRLIMNGSISLDAEEEMIKKLKIICGYEYTSRLHQMFTDIRLNEGVNSEFSSYLNKKNIKLTVNFSASVLQSGAWPLNQTSSPYSIPPDLERSLTTFEEYYCTSLHRGRKLVWLPYLSTAELRMTYLKKGYYVTTTTYQMAVLLLYNNALSYTGRDIATWTQLTEKELIRTLSSLEAAKILIKENSREGNSYKLNLEFGNKRTKFKIASSSIRESPQEITKVHSRIEEERKLFLQATIVRIMKSRKVLNHNSLLEEVIKMSVNRFSPSIVLIKKCIELLIEKDYMKRNEGRQDEYNYIA
ncbi:uncharacterized protein TRIADDRAFT_22645 [Trichoplax adhaerens]|uniref:Cullin family profile domain-containing protein n=1 Tax=Trichoplax adhaerens TaxID=10228 RepID=B3RQS9_TRIAD|nr:hypothetical protein TRIADDRAFT_22645 [Trichoplax adhaerens]EDV26756.1 hypothetical protein TRIADDRAFT_22645 [Trichoplax adhaerens]|eukprot:XP_002110752.1 hypothetical protein TRIADDRAFT_22645 [Trichoplax adhaerens]